MGWLVFLDVLNDTEVKSHSPYYSHDKGDLYWVNVY